MQPRVFPMSLATVSAMACTLARAQALVDEKVPRAVALGYVAVAKRVDTKKLSKFVAGQVCSSCSLYQGKPTDKAAAFALFPGKPVAGPGWCNAWV